MWSAGVGNSVIGSLNDIASARCQINERDKL
jgi:hypothetical protein